MRQQKPAKRAEINKGSLAQDCRFKAFLKLIDKGEWRAKCQPKGLRRIARSIMQRGVHAGEWSDGQRL